MLNLTVDNSKVVLKETVKINSHVRILIDEMDKLIKESHITEEISGKLKNISSELKKINSDLTTQVHKFKI